VLKFDPLVHLVTAAYAKNDNGTTSGLSIALVVNQDGSVNLPRDHFLNAELLDYFDENHPVDWQLAERDLPSDLHGYHLVAGSVGSTGDFAARIGGSINLSSTAKSDDERSLMKPQE